MLSPRPETCEPVASTVWGVVVPPPSLTEMTRSSFSRAQATTRSLTGRGMAWRTLLPTSSLTTTRASSIVPPSNPLCSSHERSSWRTVDAEGALKGSRRRTVSGSAPMLPSHTSAAPLQLLAGRSRGSMTSCRWCPGPQSAKRRVSGVSASVDPRPQQVWTVGHHRLGTEVQTELQVILGVDHPDVHAELLVGQPPLQAWLLLEGLDARSRDPSRPQHSLHDLPRDRALDEQYHLEVRCVPLDPGESDAGEAHDPSRGVRACPAELVEKADETVLDQAAVPRRVLGLDREVDVPVVVAHDLAQLAQGEHPRVVALGLLCLVVEIRPRVLPRRRVE